MKCVRLIIAFPNYTAQNLGAGKPERVRAGFFAGLRLVWMLCLPLTALYWLAAPALVGVFLKSATGLALESGVSFLRIVAPFYFVVASKLVSDGVLRGSGQMKQFKCATFSDLILRIMFAFLHPLAWAIAAYGPPGPWAGSSARRCPSHASSQHSERRRTGILDRLN